MSRYVQLAVSVILLGGLFAFVPGTREMWSILRLLDGGWALLALLILTADRLLMTYKWLLLLEVRGYRVSILDGTRLYCSAMIWGLALPTTVGADAVRTLLLQRRGVRVADAVSAIVVERGIGFLAGVTLAVISLLVLEFTWEEFAPYRPLIVFGTLGLIAGALLLVFSFRDSAFGLFERMVPARWHESGLVRKLRELHDAYRSFATQHSTIAKFSALTFGEQLLPLALMWTAAQALDVELSMLALLGALPIALLLAKLPFSFDGIGVFEGVLVALLSHAGVSPGEALALAVATRVLMLLALLPWWIAYTLNAQAPPLLASADAALNNDQGPKRHGP